MTLEMCATTEENLPCCHDHSNYSVHVIQKLRMYFATMPKVDQRLFVSPVIRCTLADSHIAKKGDLSNVKLHLGFSLEKPDILEEHRTEAIATPLPMNSPEDSTAHRVRLRLPKVPSVGTGQVTVLVQSTRP